MRSVHSANNAFRPVRRGELGSEQASGYMKSNDPDCQDRWGEAAALQDSEHFLCADRGMHGTQLPRLMAGVSRGNVNISWASRVRAEVTDLRRL